MGKPVYRMESSDLTLHVRYIFIIFSYYVYMDEPLESPFSRYVASIVLNSNELSPTDL